MAIVFNCPFCTSPIRVPDSAGGKRGNCPRCRTPILVPKLTAKPEPENADEPPAKPSKEKPKRKSRRPRLTPEPDFSGLPGAKPPADDSAAVHDAATPSSEAKPETLQPTLSTTSERPPSLPPDAAAGAQVDTPYTRALKRRQKRGRFVWIPLLFGAILVGSVALFFIVFGKKQLSGTLNAIAVADATLEPRTISESMMGATKAQIQVVTRRLNEFSLSFEDSNGFSYEITATGANLKLHVDSSDTMPLIRVAVRDNATLRDFLKKNAANFDKPRERDLKAGLKRFLEGAAQSISGKSPISTESQDLFKRKVAANLLVGGAGYNLMASVRGTAYPCLYEDKQGRLYFALPKGTKKFTLKGRELADGTTLFPGSYTVLVSGTLKSGSTTKSDRKTNDDP